LNALKSEMLAKKITHSYVRCLTYKNATELLMPVNGMNSLYVQTFCKINRFSLFGGSRRKQVAKVDPTRRISNRWQRQKHWVFADMWMHHYFVYRKDFISKCQNSSAGRASAAAAAKSHAALDCVPTIKQENRFKLPIFDCPFHKFS